MSKEINEYEFLAKHFNETEVQDIRRNREDFDEKLRYQKSKSIYLEYIEFERNVVIFINKNIKDRSNGKLIKLITEKVKSIYEEALCHHESDPDILKGYLKLLLRNNNYLQEAKSTIEKIKKNSNIKSEDVEKIFTECFSELSEDGYIQYLTSLLDREENYKNSKDPQLKKHITEVFERGVEIHRLSQRIWVAYLSFIFQSNETEKYKTIVFERSIAAIPNNTEELWKLYILYKESVCSVDQPEMMIEVYKKAIKSRSSVSNFYKPVLIGYVANYIGIEDARKYYNSLTENAEPCLELHLKMINLEKFEYEDDPKYLRNCFENATKFYGKTNVELWVNYYEFGKNCMQPLNNIVEKAKEALTAEDFLKFQKFIN